MAKKKGILLETQIEKLKSLNGILLKETVENREQIHKLRSEISSHSADNEILDSTASDLFKLVLSSGISKKAESAADELVAARMRLVDVSKEKDGIERDLEQVVKERDFVKRDFEEKRKEMERGYALMLKEKKVVDAKCRKLEEELQSVRFDEDEGKNLAEKLVTEMGVILSRNDEELDSLKAENKENASKISSLEEECCLLKEIREKLENEVCDMKVELLAEIAKFERLEKERFDSEEIFQVKMKEMTMQINELKGDITNMAAKKKLDDQRCGNYVIQIGTLQAEISELQSARKSLEDAHRSCSQKIANNETISAAVQRERDLKTEIVALKMRLHESMKAKQIVELKLEQMHKQLNHLSEDNKESKKHIASLKDEKSFLETIIETSKQELQGFEKKLETLKDASDQVFALVKKITEEVMDKERTQENCTCREIGLEIENEEEMMMSMENLELIKIGMKEKDTKINDLNKELLQLPAAYAKNKRAIWKWLFPATTTIFAAVCLAFAASAR